MIPLIFGHHLLPPSILGSDAFLVLMSFVAINTVGYVALSIAKVVPALHPTTWTSKRRRRSAARGIHPEDAG